MSVNKNALLRYKTIDKCLQNNYRKWSLNDLIDACSDALYEYEGKDSYVSKRTVQLDIQMMRSDKLGYNAPIVVYDRKLYRYADPEYSITKSPISTKDLSKLTEAVKFLKQFQGFSHFKDLGSMVQKLEDHVYTQKTNENPLIDFEKNEDLKGLEFLDGLYQHILNKRAVSMTYQSFKARQKTTFVFHPFLLKEFRNRWFVIGKKEKEDSLLNLALDRIIGIDLCQTPYCPDSSFSSDTYYKNVIGVSVSPNSETEKIVLWVGHSHAPYVLTKPLHFSQKEIERDNYGVTISLNVQHNFELEKAILAFGEGVKVVEPEHLRRKVTTRLIEAIDIYQTDINTKILKNINQRLLHKGFSIINRIFTKREVRKIKSVLDKYVRVTNSDSIGIREVLIKLPILKALLFNENFKKVLKHIDSSAFLTKAVYFEKSPSENWYVTWHQDVPINVKSKTKVSGYTSWTIKHGVTSVCPPEEISKNSFSLRIHLDDTTYKNGALKVIPGSHNTRLSDTEIKLISSNSIPFISEVEAGGIQVLKPLLLHASSKSTVQSRRRVLHLEFASLKLPEGLEYSEKIEF